MLPVVLVAPSPGCGEPRSAPVRARGIALPAATSSVDGEIEPGGAAAELGAGPEPDVPDAEPGAAEPAAPAAPEDAAPEDAPPDDPPLDRAKAAAPKASDAASARGNGRASTCGPPREGTPGPAGGSGHNTTSISPAPRLGTCLGGTVRPKTTRQSSPMGVGLRNISEARPWPRAKL